MILFAEVMDRIVSADNFGERWSALTSCLDSIGADQVNYGVFDCFNYVIDEAPVTFISTMSDEWIAYYGDRRFDLNDPHVKFARQGRLLPYKWGESVLRKIDDRLERVVVAETVSAGLKAQMNVILPDALDPFRPVGGLTIGSSLREREYFGSIAGREEDLTALAMAFHLRSLGEVRREQAGAVALSARERDCMAYIASGLRIDRIADKLGLSDVTVEMHMRNARRKLRASTTPQAVARAMIFGDVKF